MSSLTKKRLRGARTYMSPSSFPKKNIAPVEEPIAQVTEGGCVHHWVIDPPNGAVSQGSCKVCGEAKEFRNSFEYSSWYGNKSPESKGGAPDKADDDAGKDKPESDK
jgi:hypothetical protein